MIRVLIQELEDNRRDHIQSIQFEMKQELYGVLGESAFSVMVDALRRNSLLLESKHKKATREVL